MEVLDTQEIASASIGGEAVERSAPSVSLAAALPSRESLLTDRSLPLDERVALEQESLLQRMAELSTDRVVAQESGDLEGLASRLAFLAEQPGEYFRVHDAYQELTGTEWREASAKTAARVLLSHPSDIALEMILEIPKKIASATSQWELLEAMANRDHPEARAYVESHVIRDLITLESDGMGDSDRYISNVREKLLPAMQGKLSRSTEQQILDAYEDPKGSYYNVAIEFVHGSTNPKVVQALSKYVNRKDDGRFWCEALYCLSTCPGGPDANFFLERMEISKSTYMRSAAVRSLGNRISEEVVAEIYEQIIDDRLDGPRSDTLRSDALLAISKHNSNFAAQKLIDLALQKFSNDDQSAAAALELALPMASEEQIREVFSWAREKADTWSLDGYRTATLSAIAAYFPRAVSDENFECLCKIVDAFEGVIGEVRLRSVLQAFLDSAYPDAESLFRSCLRGREGEEEKLAARHALNESSSKLAVEIRSKETKSEWREVKPFGALGAIIDETYGDFRAGLRNTIGRIRSAVGFPGSSLAKSKRAPRLFAAHVNPSRVTKNGLNYARAHESDYLLEAADRDAEFLYRPEVSALEGTQHPGILARVESAFDKAIVTGVELTNFEGMADLLKILLKGSEPWTQIERLEKFLELPVIQNLRTPISAEQFGLIRLLEPHRERPEVQSFLVRKNLHL